MSALASLRPRSGLVSRLLATLFDLPEPFEPTGYPPGSAGKVIVMAERLRRREPIFHPDDAKADNHPAPEVYECGPRAQSSGRALPKGITIRQLKVNNCLTVYRVRPWVRGRGLVQVGDYRTLDEAIRALKAFWREQRRAA